MTANELKRIPIKTDNIAVKTNNVDIQHFIHQPASQSDQFKTFVSMLQKKTTVQSFMKACFNINYCPFPGNVMHVEFFPLNERVNIFHKFHGFLQEQECGQLVEALVNKTPIGFLSKGHTYRVCHALRMSTEGDLVRIAFIQSINNIVSCVLFTGELD